MTPDECAAARELVGWTRLELAAKAGIGTAPLLMLEVGHATLRPETLEKIKLALEAAGVEFIAENGGGPGVRLRKITPETTP